MLLLALQVQLSLLKTVGGFFISWISYMEPHKLFSFVSTIHSLPVQSGAKKSKAFKALKARRQSR